MSRSRPTARPIRNSPFLTLALLAGFIALAVRAHADAPEVIVPPSQQIGYSQKDLRQSTAFVALQIKQNPVVLYRADQREQLSQLFDVTAEVDQ